MEAAKLKILKSWRARECCAGTPTQMVLSSGPHCPSLTPMWKAAHRGARLPASLCQGGCFLPPLGERREIHLVC